MTVLYSDDYISPDGGRLLKQDGGAVLQETSDFILLDYPDKGTANSKNNAMIVHSGLWYEGGTATANNTATGFFEDAPLNSLTYEKWKAAGTAPSTWEYDHGSDVTADSFCIAAHTLYTSGSTFAVQYHDGADWVDIVSGQTVPDDSALMVFFNEVTASRWRVFISAWTTAPKIGVVRVSPALMMPQRIYGGHTPIDLARNTVMRTNKTETGEFAGRSIERTSDGTSFNWTHLYPGWVRDHWYSVQRGIEAEPFWIAWRPESYGRAVGYAHVDEVPKPSNMGVSGFMEVTMQVTSLGYD